MRSHVLLATVLLLGCDAPLALAPAEAPVVVNQTNSYTTNVFVTQATGASGAWVAAPSPAPTSAQPSSEANVPAVVVEERTNVPACEAYLAYVERCADALTPASDDGRLGEMRASLEQARHNWSEAASRDANAKRALESACTTSLTRYRATVPRACQ